MHICCLPEIVDTVRSRFTGRLRAVPGKTSCSRLRLPESLTRLSGGSAEPRCVSAYYNFPKNTKAPPIGDAFVFGGRLWIRTTEVSDNRFTVCPLWPLGKSPIMELVDGFEPPTY